MAVSFQIDAVTMPLDPYNVEWTPKEELDRAHSGAPIFNIKRTVRLKFDDMTLTNFAIFLGYDNGASHTVKIPAESTSTYTNYAGVYWRKVSANLSDIAAYSVEFEASWVEA